MAKIELPATPVETPAFRFVRPHYERIQINRIAHGGASLTDTYTKAAVAVPGTTIRGKWMKHGREQQSHTSRVIVTDNGRITLSIATVFE